MDDTGRRSAASDVAVVRRRPAGPSTARCGSYTKFLLAWSAGEAVAVVVYLLAGRVWGFVVAGVLFALGCLFTCYYINLPGQQEPPRLLPVAGQTGGGGLSQEDIEAVPAFEYFREETASAGAGSSGAADEECAVCISVVRGGETVRRLPACGHVYHARCINGWLRAHASCPMCRAAVKVAAAGEPSAGAAV